MHNNALIDIDVVHEWCPAAIYVSICASLLASRDMLKYMHIQYAQ